MLSNPIHDSINLHLEFATSHVTIANRWDHFLARVGWRRNRHCVTPGLYALGNPAEDSPVFVTANYTLSFDALRTALNELDSYILVLETEGINVWCAAGKGTFGTDELVNRIESTKLHEVVKHRNLILPQLGAPGVAAHDVKKRTGFNVEYGPVRSTDLAEYLKSHRASPEMRRVHFRLRDRLVLIPVEFVHLVLPASILLVVISLLRKGPFLGNFHMGDAGLIAAFLAGVVLFPVLLPWIPTADLSTKGFILGGLVVIPFILLISFSQNIDLSSWRQIGTVFNTILLGPPITAFFALQFTGATTFTSRSGVRREIFKYIPIMALLFGSGIMLSVFMRLF